MRACARRAVTGDRSWLAGAEMAVAWFLGDNDAKIPLLDERTGGGCDGLSRDQPQPQPGSRVDAGDDLRDAAGAAAGLRVAMRASRVASELLTRTEHRIRPDASRTLGRLFVPGQETLIRGGSRAMAVIDRILDLNELQVEHTLARTLARFSAGYRDLTGTLERNFSLVAHRVGAEIEVGSARRQLIGAYFTQEYALEAAALFNPSIVVHPDQAGCQPGEARFVMSLRAVGEGHLSSIEFRTGTIGDDAGIRFDSPGRFLDTGHTRPVPYDRNLFRKKLTELGQDDENAKLLWHILPPRFTATELTAALAELSRQQVTRTDSTALVDRVRWMAASNYAVEFGAHHSLPERVLWPAARPRATAWKTRGSCASPTVRTRSTTRPTRRSMARRSRRTCWKHTDFRTFTISQLSGSSAANKGMALFPRRIAGRYAALSRWDRESNAIAYSHDAHRLVAGPDDPVAGPSAGN